MIICSFLVVIIDVNMSEKICTLVSKVPLYSILCTYVDTLEQISWHKM